MNVWSEIVEMMVANKGMRELLIAPHAPPVSRTPDGFSVVSSRIFSAEDIVETLANLLMYSGGKKVETLAQTGVLCLGMKDIGRLRVCYFTQRGSRMLRIVRVPFDVPTIEMVCAEPAYGKRLAEVVGRRDCRTMLMYGPSHTANSQAAYAILGHINQTQTRLIYVVEHTLSFLLAHSESLVVQVELKTDVPSLEEAIQNAFLLEPDIVFLGDVRTTEEFPGLRQLFHSDATTILSTFGDSPAPLLERLPPLPGSGADQRNAALLVEVLPEPDGRIRLRAQPWQSGAHDGVSAGS